MLEGKKMLEFARDNGIYLGGLALSGSNMTSAGDTVWNTEILWIRKDIIDDNSNHRHIVYIGVIISVPTENWKEFLKVGMFTLGTVVTSLIEVKGTGDFTIITYYIEDNVMERAGLRESLRKELLDAVKNETFLDESPWF